jgi:integrase/recombinase XerD
MNRNPEYSFTAEIQARLKGFKTYLDKQGNDKSTVCQKLNYTGYFLKWLDKERLQEAETTYNDLMEFIDWCKMEGKSKRHINTIIRSVRNYYDYLKTNQVEIINPAANLDLKGIRHKLPMISCESKCWKRSTMHTLSLITVPKGIRSCWACSYTRGSPRGN